MVLPRHSLFLGRFVCSFGVCVRFCFHFILAFHFHVKTAAHLFNISAMFLVHSSFILAATIVELFFRFVDFVHTTHKYIHIYFSQGVFGVKNKQYRKGKNKWADKKPNNNYCVCELQLVYHVIFSIIQVENARNLTPSSQLLFSFVVHCHTK